MSRHPALADDGFGEPTARPDPPEVREGDPWGAPEHLRLVAGEAAEPLPRDRGLPPGARGRLAERRARLIASRAFREARFYSGLIAFMALSTAIAFALMVIVAAAVPGWKTVFITSNSMAPAIQRGDLVVGVPVDAVEPGSIVVFDDPAGGGLVTHRVIETFPDGRHLTAGDANGRSDSTPVDPANVHGTGRFLIPYIGWPLIWLTERAWTPMFLMVIATSLVAWWSRFGLLDAYSPWHRPSISDTS